MVFARSAGASAGSDSTRPQDSRPLFGFVR